MTDTLNEDVSAWGDDAKRWAAEFMTRVEAGVVIDEALMLGWFANAIEVSHDTRFSRFRETVDEAVAEEREACAKTCEQVDLLRTGDYHAKQIRGRSKQVYGDGV